MQQYSEQTTEKKTAFAKPKEKAVAVTEMGEDKISDNLILKMYWKGMLCRKNLQNVDISWRWEPKERSELKMKIIDLSAVIEGREWRAIRRKHERLLFKQIKYE